MHEEISGYYFFCWLQFRKCEHVQGKCNREEFCFCIDGLESWKLRRVSGVLSHGKLGYDLLDKWCKFGLVGNVWSGHFKIGYDRCILTNQSTSSGIYSGPAMQQHQKTPRNAHESSTTSPLRVLIFVSDGHIEDFHSPSAFGLAPNKLTQPLKRTRFSKANHFPVISDNVLRLNLLHVA
jgi:hypothetical protein